MNHTQLRSFRAVATDGGFTVASRVLNVGQPTITRQVKALERGFADLPQMTSNFVDIVPRYCRQGNCIPSAAIRWHNFGDRPALGRPFGAASD